MAGTPVASVGNAHPYIIDEQAGIEDLLTFSATSCVMDDINDASYSPVASAAPSSAPSLADPVLRRLMDLHFPADEPDLHAAGAAILSILVSTKFHNMRRVANIAHSFAQDDGKPAAWLTQTEVSVWHALREAAPPGEYSFDAVTKFFRLIHNLNVSPPKKAAAVIPKENAAQAALHWHRQLTNLCARESRWRPILDRYFDDINPPCFKDATLPLVNAAGVRCVLCPDVRSAHYYAWSFSGRASFQRLHEHISTHPEFDSPAPPIAMVAATAAAQPSAKRTFDDADVQPARPDKRAFIQLPMDAFGRARASTTTTTTATSAPTPSAYVDLTTPRTHIGVDAVETSAASVSDAPATHSSIPAPTTPSRL